MLDVEQRANHGRLGVLSEEVVADDGDDKEENHLQEGESGQRLREVLGLAHLGDERGVEDLTDPQEGLMLS